ncbi:MAG TPA: PQQ-like beta-propeller repeat protein [Paludibacter sp.]|nr:PQQ-like beta-propeller repeat protein [Paludibacter sp.]
MTKNQIFIAAIALFSFSISGISQELVQWRGAERSGVYNETGLLKEWPAEGPKLLWQFDGLGRGFTSVTIANGKIYTTGETEGSGFVYALNKDGKQIWKTEYGKDWADSYPGTRTTPVYFKGNLFLATAFGEALCLNAETGKKVWSVDMKEKFGARDLKWGIVEAPVILGNKVFFTPGGENSAIVALDIKTGETIWTSKATGEVSAYCSPLLFNYKGKNYFTTALSGNVVGIDVNDGSLLWKVAQVNMHSIHPNTPLYKDGHIYSVTGYKVGGVMLKLSDDGRSVTELWRNPTLDSQMGGAVWINNYIVGSGTQNDRSWQCLDAKTGQVLHKSTAIGKGVVVYADGLFYCYADNGEMGIMELNDSGFNLKSKFRIVLGSEQHWAHPVIDKGILYVRHGNTLMAYDIKK